jgi:hypothetical protein
MVCFEVRANILYGGFPLSLVMVERVAKGFRRELSRDTAGEPHGDRDLQQLRTDCEDDG